MSIDRAALVDNTYRGHARALAGLTPPTALTALHRIPGQIRAHRHDPAKAARLWRAAGGASRALRLACMPELGTLAHQVAGQLRDALGLAAEVTVLDNRDQQYDARRTLAAEHTGDWDILLLQQGSQTADVPPLELHRAFLGRTGEFRAGPVDTRFEQLFDRLRAQTSQARQVLAANSIDRYVNRHALALFLVAPQALYAVNDHVNFKPYATTFELADTSVRRRHWSRTTATSDADGERDSAIGRSLRGRG